MSDCNAAGDVQALHEHGEFVGLAVSISVFQNLHAVAARPGFSPRVLKGFRNPEPASFIDRHCNGIDDVWFRCHKFNAKSFRDRHSGDGLRGAQRRPGWFILRSRNKVLLSRAGETHGKDQNRSVGKHKSHESSLLKQRGSGGHRPGIAGGFGMVAGTILSRNLRITPYKLEAPTSEL